MSRTDRNKEGTRRNRHEGTAARTRPFSFEEIMSRRKIKLSLKTDDQDRKTKEIPGNVNHSFEFASSNDGHKIRNALNDNLKYGSENKESTSRRDRDCIERKCADTSDLEADMKVKSIYDRSSRDKQNNDEKYRYHASKSSKAFESEKMHGKKRSKDLEEKYKYKDFDGKSKRDRKNKGSSHNKVESGSLKSKNYDSVKLRDVKLPERSFRKNDHFETSYEDSRLKRRRSRSQDYDRERGRSASMSPLSIPKRGYGGPDYKESYKTISKKKHSNGDRYRTPVDSDRYRVSGDGGYSSGHYRNHGSGLGGYSPRKRKTEAVVKTPSPTARSPERKSATWDQPPPGTSNNGAGSMFTAFLLPASKVMEVASSVASATPSAKTQLATSVDSVSVVMNASVESVQLTQATRPLRRLYIENLPSSASEKSVIDCLNDYLLSSCASHMQRTKPCISCIINRDKLQALVEFLTPEDATSALSFDGKTLSGSVLKMRRPKDFVEAADRDKAKDFIKQTSRCSARSIKSLLISGSLLSVVPEKSGNLFKTMSDAVMDSPHKIFVGGISEGLSSKMFMEIASAFGILKAYHFDYNNELNGQCAFLEYEDHSITAKACAGLNGLMFAGCMLTAVRAFPDANVEDYASLPSYAVPPHAKPLLVEFTEVLKLQNVVNEEDLSSLSEIELEETVEDIRIECARFGAVKSVHLVRRGRSVINPMYDACERQDHVFTAIGHESDVDHGNETRVNTNEDKFEVVKELPLQNDVPSHEITKKDEAKEDEMKGAIGATEELQDADLDANLQTDESNVEDNDAISQLPPPRDKHDAELAKITDLNPIAKDIAESKGDGDQILDDSFQTPEEQLALVPEAFEPGSVIVEFRRKEAARKAAHGLHGRCYGDRTVVIEYVPTDLYLKSFPK